MGTLENNEIEKSNLKENTGKKIIEQNIDFPEFDEQDLIRVDMNIIEYPLFSRNKKRGKNEILKYYFNNNKNKYIEITPAAGDMVPGEFEKAVFIALTRILKDRGYPKKFSTNAREILNNMEISESSKKKLHGSVRDSLIRLGKTSYEFNNTLYSSREKSLLNSKTITKILEINMITKLQFEEKKDKMTSEEIEENLKYFTDGRVKEVFIISFGDYFYDNIITKGYLVYSAPELLELRRNGTALDILLLITKLRRTDLKYRRGLLKLAGSIGFKVNLKNVRRTKDAIDKACKLLKEKKHIENYIIEETSDWKSAYIEFHFTERHNKIKQENFFEERKLFDDIYVSQSDTLQINLDSEEKKLVESNVTVNREATELELKFVYEHLQYQIRRLKTTEVFLKNAISKYGVERVVQAAIYTKYHAKVKLFDYFRKAIEFNYGSKIEIELPTELVIESIEIETGVKNHNKKEENKSIYSKEVAFDKFSELDRQKQLSLISEALDYSYKKLVKENPNMTEFIKERMMESLKEKFKNDPQKNIGEWLVETKYFETSGVNTQELEPTTIEEQKIKELFEQKRKEQIVNLNEEKNIELKKEIIKPMQEENNNFIKKEEIKPYINGAIELYGELIDLDEDTIKKMKKDIALKIVPIALEGKLTKKGLEELIKIEIDKM